MPGLWVSHAILPHQKIPSYQKGKLSPGKPLSLGNATQRGWSWERMQDLRNCHLNLQLMDHTEEANGTYAQFNLPHGNKVWYYDPLGRNRGKGAGEWWYQKWTLKRTFQSFHYYSKVKGGIGCPDPCKVNGTTIHSRVKVNKVPTTSFPPITLPETRVQVSNAHFKRMQRTQGRETECKTQGKEETTFENLEQLLLIDCVTLF